MVLVTPLITLLRVIRANNTLNGSEGNDNLIGNLGSDNLTGGLGLDQFKFNKSTKGIDNITDFSIVDDTIAVSAKGFGGGLKKGIPAPFIIGTGATSPSDRIIYNSTTGALLFDIDGNEGLAAVQFAILNTGLSLTNADILVV